MKIRIKDFEFEIIEVEDNDENFVKNGNLVLYGQTNFIEQKIKIYKNLTDVRKRKTLIHELTHAFCDVYLQSQHVKDRFNEEDICCFMASYSEDIIRIVDDYLKR